MRILVLCILLCGCGTYTYPKYVEVAEAKCKRNDGWQEYYRNSTSGYLYITCKDGAAFGAVVPPKDLQP
jgi:hypothetical protein